jgi:hypothetical protein
MYNKRNIRMDSGRQMKIRLDILLYFLPPTYASDCLKKLRGHVLKAGLVKKFV